jgi:dihydrofolate synthase/folylpolyglutamate synthase
MGGERTVYSEAIEYLYALQRFGIKFGLNNISELLKALGSPQNRLKIIHIAGTNGKGSTAAFIESVLIREGFRVGLYSSPHLIRFTERIRVNHREIEKDRVVQWTHLIRSRLGGIPITFFEFVTAMAFCHFDEEGVDFAIMEVGMGGRLDATNACQSILSVITNISLEHREYLGKTLTEIAHEKMGIIKKGASVISGISQKGVREILTNRCREMGVTLYLFKRDFSVGKRDFNLFNYKGIYGDVYKGLSSNLKGRHQGANLALSLAVIEVLRGMGFRISNKAIFEGIQQVDWRGRLEIVAGRPRILLDGAHNPAAIRTLKMAIERDFKYRSLWLLMGVMNDKDYRKMVRILAPLCKSMTFCRPKMDRSLDPKILEGLARDVGAETNRIESVGDALEFMIGKAHREDLILVTGSLFVVGEAIAYIDDKKPVPSSSIRRGSGA